MMKSIVVFDFYVNQLGLLEFLDLNIGKYDTAIRTV